MNRFKPFYTIALICSLLVGNYFKFVFISPQIRFTPLDLTVFVLVTTTLITNIKKYQIFISNKRILLLCFGLFMVTGFFSLILSLNRYGCLAGFVGLLYWLRLLIYFHLYPAFLILYSSSQIKRLLITLFITVLLSASFQYFVFPDISSLEISEWDPHYFRVVGSFLDPGFIGLILIWSLIYFFRVSFSYSVWSYLLMSFTYSRSTYLAYISGLVYFSKSQKSWKLFFFGIILLLITTLALPRVSDGEGVKLERTSSIQARILNWKNSMEIISHYPVIGVGFNTYRYAQKDFGFLTDSKWLKSHAGAGADSSLLFTTATVGILGLLFYLFYLKQLYVIKDFRPYLVTLLTHSFFLNSLYYPITLLFMALILSKIDRSDL